LSLKKSKNRLVDHESSAMTLVSDRTQTERLSRLEKVMALEFTTHSEPKRGQLTVLQFKQNLPFSIARIFYIYGTPKNTERGSHAHRETEQVLIAVSGSFSLDLSDGQQTETYELDMPARGVYIPTMIWARMRNFSENAVCLVLASTPYDPADYIRDWEEYESEVRLGAK
jgi:dTDP-4-dehydrorhamnose 3,5-epimerase-like enzyme